MQWYFAEAGRQIGPVGDDAFNGFVASGRIGPSTLVWRPGMANWEPYSAVVGGPIPGNGQPAAAEPGFRYCSECGRAFPLDDLAAFGNSHVCATCKPIYTQKLREGALQTGWQHYGGFWIRFLAILVDGLILGIVSMFYSPFFAFAGLDMHDPVRFFMVVGILSAIGFAVRIAYETAFVGRFGATPGKMVCRLKVVRPDGRPLTYTRSLCRALGKELSTFTLMIGYLMAAFDDEKRALHDRICDTRVIRT